MKFFSSLFSHSSAKEGMLASLEMIARALLGLSENQTVLTEKYVELVASQAVLEAAYKETATQLAQQQVTNAELYSFLTQIATVLKQKGVDMHFPIMDFEKVAPPDSGTN